MWVWQKKMKLYPKEVTTQKTKQTDSKELLMGQKTTNYKRQINKHNYNNNKKDVFFLDIHLK